MGYVESIYASDLSHRARTVYMYLKDRADKESRCRPGIRTIARNLGLSVSTVKRALDDLCREGELMPSRIFSSCVFKLLPSENGVLLPATLRRGVSML